MKKRLSILLTCVGLILGISGTSMYAFTEVSVENELTKGIVDIELDEYTIENGREVLWEKDVKNILPGQDIYKIPRISNLGNDCYIRARIAFIHSPLTVDSLYGMTDQWILAKDGYYYYTQVLSSGQRVDLFQGIKVPNDLNEEAADSLFEIQINVDAVQSENFTPNYTLKHPWGNVEILDCEKEGLYDVSTFKKENNLNFKIVYKGDIGQLIKNEDDFFENFPVLLPGDIYGDKLQLVNDSEERVNLYFRTKALEGTELLDHVRLKITKLFNGKENVIYEGPIGAADLNDSLLLTTLEKGESGTLFYEITVPEELDNSCTLMKDKVLWIFSAEPVDPIDTVQTGDSTFMICLCLMAAGVFFVIVGISVGRYGKVRRRYVK